MVKCKKNLGYLLGLGAVLLVSACSSMGGGVSLAQVVADEVASACNAVVGAKVKSRIDEEWAKYPDVAPTRPVIENVSKVILTMPGMTDAQRMQAYKNYMGCMTGVYLSTNSD